MLLLLIRLRLRLQLLRLRLRLRLRCLLQLLRAWLMLLLLQQLLPLSLPLMHHIDGLSLLQTSLSKAIEWELYCCLLPLWTLLLPPYLLL